VFRDQLAEVERDAARGLMAPEDAARARTEISRKILDADRRLAATSGGHAAPRGRCPSCRTQRAGQCPALRC